MADNKINWWLIVGVAVVVAVVASLITANITGNVIKLNQDRWGNYQVYTKAEIDTKLKNVFTLDTMFTNNSLSHVSVCGTSGIYRLASLNAGITSCNDICGSKKCLIGFMDKEVLKSEEHIVMGAFDCDKDITAFPKFINNASVGASCICCYNDF